MISFHNLFTEKEERDAMLIRYKKNSILDDWQEYLNTKCLRCIVLKKSAAVFVFIICAPKVIFELYVKYDNDCFQLLDIKNLARLEDSTLEIEKITKIDRNFCFAIKQEKRKYENSLSKDCTKKLYNEIFGLDSYDFLIHELKRQENIRLREKQDTENAEKQIAVWRQYLEEELRLLEKANKPFRINLSNSEIKRTYINIETIPVIQHKANYEELVQISEVVGGTVDKDELEIPLDDFWHLKRQENNVIIVAIKINFIAHSDSLQDVRDFKERYGYNKSFSYGIYDRTTSTVEITYTTRNIKEIYKFIENVNNSYYLNDTLTTSEVSVRLTLEVVTTESDEERRNRLEILNGREFYSKEGTTGIFLGTLSENGSDKKYIRLILPKEDDKKRAAVKFFKEESEGFIFPGLKKDETLITRQKKAINFDRLLNDNIKEFIFNSSKAKAIERFIGLSSNEIEQTVEYSLCSERTLLSLNHSQQEAVLKALYAEDMCLLQGPTGTGKTTVISELIWQEIVKNQEVRIMLTSQTNLAIDNALNRLFSNSAIVEGSKAWRYIMLIKPIRVADSEKIEEEGMPYSVERIDKWAGGDDSEDASNNIVFKWMRHIARRVDCHGIYEDILSEWRYALNNPSKEMRSIFVEKYKENTNVLCMTCGKVDSTEFKNWEKSKGFDVVIVDEASKATLPELLMPLRYGKKSIIIGDHRQLPPVIFEDEFFKKVREADPELEESLDEKFRHELVEESLFKRLITHPYISPTIKSTFNVQYRMHPDINSVVSQFYEEDSGGLVCGLDPTRVNAANFDDKESRYHGFLLDGFITPSVHTIWVDVPDGKEQGSEGNSSFNEKEVEAVRIVIEALSMAKGFDSYMRYWENVTNNEMKMIESRIGVISFYSEQVRRMRASIQPFCDKNGIKVTTKSVDRFQGQESGIVIVSTVKTKKL
ncbi:MAG: DEAD/DEAH box helicase, partial [Muribaculaceae bacterium]